jgi:hypothetical protein
MAFAEGKRTSMQSGQYGAAAVFTTAKSGAGTLRFPYFLFLHFLCLSQGGKYKYLNIREGHVYYN